MMGLLVANVEEPKVVKNQIIDTIVIPVIMLKVQQLIPYFIK